MKKLKSAKRMVLATLIFTAAGCAGQQKDRALEDASWIRKYRTSDVITDFFGTDPRSREIERNLGVE